MKNKRIEKLIFGLWIVLALSSVGFVSLVVGAWSALHAVNPAGRLSEEQSRFILGLSSIPGRIKTAVDSSKNVVTEDPLPLLLDKRVVEKPYWVRRFPSPEDDGYLLLSGVDPQYKQSNIRLIRISDGAVLHTWNPDWKYISTQITEKKFLPKPAPENLIANHPLPLSDGGIIFQNLAIIRMSACEDKVEDIFNVPAHHSVELDNENNLVTAGIADNYFVENQFLNNNLKDDSILKISLDGRIIENLSFSKILIDNGLESLLFGHMGSEFELDPIHLNQISIAKSDGAFWLKGDYLISARHLSSIFLYRPSTNKIIWYQSGPWKNQHSVHFVDNTTIALLDNNVYGISHAKPREYNFVHDSDINQVFLVDFSLGYARVSQPFKNQLESSQAKPKTVTAGLIRVLPDGGLFIEETNFGRYLRFTKDRFLWSFINDYDEARIGSVSWSRYLTKIEGDEFYKQVKEAKKSCLTELSSQNFPQ